MKAIVTIKLDGDNRILTVDGPSLTEICGALLQLETSDNPKIEILQLAPVCKNPQLIYWNSYLAHNLVSKGRISEDQFIEMSGKSQYLPNEDKLHTWANTYFSNNENLNTLLLRDDVYKNFISTLSTSEIQSCKLSRFKKQLENWCTANGYQFNPTKVCNNLNPNRIIKNKNGENFEYFFIRKEVVNEIS